MDRMGVPSMTASQHSFIFPSMSARQNRDLERHLSSTSLSSLVMPQKRNSKYIQNGRENVNANDVEPEGRKKSSDVGDLVIQKSSTLEANTKREDSVANKSKSGPRKTFMSFLRRGFSLRQKRRENNTSDSVHSSTFEALQATSVMQAHLSKYMAVEKSSSRLGYLPSAVQSSLPSASDTESNERSSSSSVEDIPPLIRELQNHEVDQNGSQRALHNDSPCLRGTQLDRRPPRPIPGSSRLNATRNNHSATAMNTRIWESDCIPKDQELSKQTLDNTPRTPTNTPRHEALMRRPRTPTLGRAALLVRAGYSSTERAELAGKVNERLERTTASPICGTALSRSSSINQELSEKTVNPLEKSCYSTSTLTKSDNTSETRSRLCSSPPKQPDGFRKPTCGPSQPKKPKHNYDAVPDEQYQSDPEKRRPGTLTDLRFSQISTTGTSAQAHRSSVSTSKTIQLEAKLRTKSNSESKSSDVTAESEYMCTREWRQHFGHDPELIRISDGRVSNANQMNKQVQTQYNVTSSFVFVDKKSECSLQMKPVVTSTKMAHGGYYEGDLGIEHTSGGLLFLENDTDIVKTNNYSTEKTKAIHGQDNDHRPCIYQPRNSTRSRSSQSTYSKDKVVNIHRQLLVLGCQTSDLHPAVCQKLAAACISSKSTGIFTGSVNLRRRAKPELENERHRDISLRLSVQEVKQLPSKGKYFCEICLDRTLYARTTSKQSNGTVFWGEKFELNNLPDVSIITINLYKQGDPSKEKRSRTKGQNQFLAFVTIPLKEVPQKSEMQQWLAMQSPNLIQLDHWQGGSNGVSSPGAPRFRKRSTPITCFRHSTSASAFSILNEAVDENLVTDEKSNSSVAANSRGRKKTWTAGISSPDKELSREPRSIGGLSISSSSCTTRNGLDAACVPSAFVGSNITNSFVLPDNGPMPQIRVNLQYEAMDVLPIDYYGELREFIKMHSISLVRFLEPQLTAKQKEELASCLVNIYEKLPDLSVAQLLTELLQEDLRQHHDESMIFRSNSTGSKAVECYIKLVGNDYLRQTLKTSIDQLLSTSEDFEIDPSRVTSIESNGTANQAIQVDKNREALIRHLKVIWGLIFSSAPALPRELREVFASLSYSVEQTHSSKTAARLISSCLFLRFICPAIHGPVLFGLTAAVPESGRLSRNLTLVAKVLQNLANLALFEEKERHMRSLNTFVEAEIPRMHSFLQSISAMPADEEATETTDCHKFIDLGYEFAKLTSLLVAYTRDRTLPEELCDLFGILSFIDEHTNDAFLSSWTPDVVSCRRYASCDSAGPLLPNRPRFNSTDSVPCLPAVQGQSEKDGFSNYSSTMEDSGMGSQSAFLNEHGTGLQRAVAQSSSTALSSHRGSTSESALETFCLPEPLEDDEENAEDLITQYQEQLRQLNACIDRVESSEVCPRAITSHPHVMRVNGPGTPTQLVPGPKDSKPSVVLPANRDLSISHIPTHSATAVMANGMEELCGVSDYESGDLTERSEGLCHSEPMNTRGRPADSGTSEQLDLSGSPSLDQLAERLHELRLLLKHERQELEQVVATKTQVIQQQEQSIEQLASELNQLRRAPVTQEPGRDRQSNGRKWPSGTVSPSSSCSLSSECQMSYQSDGACPLTDDFSGLSCDAGAFTTSSTQNPELSFGTPLTMVFGNGVQPRAQRFRAKAWSDRTEPTILTSTKTSNTDAMNRYGPNLLDLSRASEGTGIPLGDLIVSKQSLPVRRRLSESKLLHP